MKLYLLSLFWICSINSLVAQKRNNNWYFGDHAAITFNTSPPTPLNNSVMEQLEGNSTISDNNGNLLFYSDGVTIWNRNHQVMLNGTGLLGGYSSSQSALIVPKPLDNNLYYIFTVPQQSTTIPLSYSIVDMSLDGGNGAVTVKNITLHVPVLEKLTGTPNSNNSGYWIVAKEYNSDAFYAYSLTASGIASAPVISHAGMQATVYTDLGYAKFSANGSKFCIAYEKSKISQLFDFNNNTGIFSNPINLVYNYPNNPNGGPYGVEFSPDNSKLYIVIEGINSVILQYDLLAGSPTDIQNSVIKIAEEGTSEYAGPLALGPDNKIYISYYHRPYLAAINQPNLTGTACNYVNASVNLAPGTRCELGLPNQIKYPITPPCPASTSLSFSVNICANQTYQLPSGIMVNGAGDYIDTLKSNALCDSIIYSIHITVTPITFITIDANICPQQTYHLPSGTSVTSQGIYIDTLKSQSLCDSLITTVHLVINDISYSTFSDSIYVGEKYILPSGSTVNSPGTYQSIFKNSLGCDSIVTTILKQKRNLFKCLIVNSAFTPNGDGINDVWGLYQTNCFKNIEVNVYNRYGSLVYHSPKYENSWDGKYNNHDLPDGTYYYVAKLMSYDNKEDIIKGNVTIIR